MERVGSNYFQANSAHAPTLFLDPTMLRSVFGGGLQSLSAFYLVIVVSTDCVDNIQPSSV